MSSTMPSRPRNPNPKVVGNSWSPRRPRRCSKSIRCACVPPTCRTHMRPHPSDDARLKLTLRQTYDDTSSQHLRHRKPRGSSRIRSRRGAALAGGASRACADNEARHGIKVLVAGQAHRVRPCTHRAVCMAPESIADHRSPPCPITRYQSQEARAQATLV